MARPEVDSATGISSQGIRGRPSTWTPFGGRMIRRVAPTPPIDVRRADDRFHTRLAWLDSHHSFSFSRHYDPRNVGHGLLLVNNDDIVRAGTGFSTHPHQDMEIVTWVLSGELEHKDSAGQRRRHLPRPGPAHERRHGHLALGDEPVGGRGRPLRADVGAAPTPSGIDPGYEQLDVNAELDKGGLVPIASGPGPRRRHRHPPAGRRAVGRAAARRARRSPSPTPGYAHVFVAAGRVRHGGRRAGRAARPATRCGSPRRALRRWWSTTRREVPRCSSGRWEGRMTTILVAHDGRALPLVEEWPELLHIEPILDVAGDYVLVAGYGVQERVRLHRRATSRCPAPPACCRRARSCSPAPGGRTWCGSGSTGGGNSRCASFDAVAGRDALVPAPRRPAHGPHHWPSTTRARMYVNVHVGRHPAVRRRRAVVGADHRHRRRRPPGGDRARPSRPRAWPPPPGGWRSSDDYGRHLEDHRRRAARHLRPGRRGGRRHGVPVGVGGPRRHQAAVYRRPLHGPRRFGKCRGGLPRARSPATSTPAASPPPASSWWSAPPTAASSARRTAASSGNRSPPACPR